MLTDANDGAAFHMQIHMHSYSYAESYADHMQQASRISSKNKKNKIMILILTKYKFCCVNVNDVDELFIFVSFVIKRGEIGTF